MSVITDASAASLHPFVTASIEPGATAMTDGWNGYSGIERLDYTRDRRSQRAARARGEDPGKLLPGVHRVASLAKRWLLGTHQGSIEETHLQSYLVAKARAVGVRFRTLVATASTGPARVRTSSRICRPATFPTWSPSRRMSRSRSAPA